MIFFMTSSILMVTISMLLNIYTYLFIYLWHLSFWPRYHHFFRSFYADVPPPITTLARWPQSSRTSDGTWSHGIGWFCREILQETHGFLPSNWLGFPVKIFPSSNSMTWMIWGPHFGKPPWCGYFFVILTHTRPCYSSFLLKNCYCNGCYVKGTPIFPITSMSIYIYTVQVYSVHV